MKLDRVVLDPEDLDKIADALCEHYDSNVADSELTDLFILLTKIGQPVTFDIGIDDVTNASVQNILNEVGSLDLDEDCIIEEDINPDTVLMDKESGITDECWDTKDEVEPVTSPKGWTT